MTLDKLSLDEMVQGLETSDKKWEKLLRHPDAEKVWADAVKRREKLNAFCRFAAKWPSMVLNYKMVKSFTKKSINSPLVSIFSPNYESFNVTLSGRLSSGDKNSLSINVIWGEQQIFELDDTTRLSFKTDATLNIYYSYSGGDGVINSNNAWDFTPHEGAVLLTFVDGEYLGDDFESILGNAKSVASVVLMPS
jgi:hypothetical protein